MGNLRAPAIIGDVVREHAEEAAFLHALRTSLTQAPHAKLRDIVGFDERIAAHQDGLAVAGEFGWSFCDALLEIPSPSNVFTAVVRAIEAKQQQRIDRCFALAKAVPESRAGLASALGWTGGQRLQSLVAALLGSQDPFGRFMGVSACALHRVDPGLVSARLVMDSSSTVRARALRTAGEIGCQEGAPACAAGIHDDNPECQFWSAWSGVLLGNRGTSLEALKTWAMTPHGERTRAFRLALQATSLTTAHTLLQSFARESKDLRWLIQGSGIAGDPIYVPWLIGHMSNVETARLAGEAFSLITAADLGLSSLDGEPPKNFESGPNDDTGDPNVDMDPDDGLPWPDPERIKAWWSKQGGSFQPGTRYFIGAPVTREHCIDVLKNGYQRQRILAAHHLCLLRPGTPLFNTSAPAWRQQRLLAEMS